MRKLSMVRKMFTRAKAAKVAKHPRKKWNTRPVLRTLSNYSSGMTGSHVVK